MCLHFFIQTILIILISLTRGADGITWHVKQKRLTGSEEAAIGEFPWQVRLRSFGQNTYSGVLVGYNWVLTAASCFDGNYHPSLWNAVLGDYNSANQDSGERSVFVESIFIYGGFRGGNEKDNIALVKLRLDQVAALDVQFSPVSPANGSEDLTTLCYLTGWGALQSGQESSPILRKMRLSLANSTDCERQFDSTIASNQLCTLDTNTSIGPCTGDRGSPVLCKTGDSWSAVGVVSEEYACQSSYAPPGTFVNVAYYSQWIYKIMNKF